MGIRIKIITLEERGFTNRYVLYHEFGKGDRRYVLLILEKTYREMSGCIFDESALKRVLVLYEEYERGYFRIFDNNLLEEAYQSAISYKKEV